MQPAFKFRGVMLDPGRITENKDYYRRLLPELAGWGYNLIHMHLIDDQRCALVFPSHPELATPGAFTVDEMREFIAVARSHGIEVMPEVESLGHAALITTHPKHKHLGEKVEHEYGFNAICPSHPGTRQILSDLLRDTADIFPHEVLHVGLDEVEFGKSCPHCRRKFGTESPAWERFAEHAAWVHAEVRKLGRRPAMWADHAVGEPSMLAKFKRDVLMFNWNYVPEYPSHKSAILLDAGFEVVACPATVCFFTRVTPNLDNFANLRHCMNRSLAQRRRGRGVTGMVNTVWCPWRYLPGAIDHGLAMAGELFETGTERPDFSRRFAEDFYGVTNGTKLGVALDALVRLSPDVRLYDRTIEGVSRNEPFTAEDARLWAELAGQIRPVLATLKAERKKVRRNRERFDDVVLSAESILAVALFGAAGRKKSAVPGAKTLYRRALTAWGRDRHANDSLRFGEGRHGAVQALLFVLRRIS